MTEDHDRSGGSRGSESLGGYDDRRDGPSLIHSGALQMPCMGCYGVLLRRGITLIVLTCMEGLALEWGLEKRMRSDCVEKYGVDGEVADKDIASYQSASLAPLEYHWNQDRHL